jgi:hypothetical protein
MAYAAAKNRRNGMAAAISENGDHRRGGIEMKYRKRGASAQHGGVWRKQRGMAAAKIWHRKYESKMVAKETKMAQRQSKKIMKIGIKRRQAKEK